MLLPSKLATQTLTLVTIYRNSTNRRQFPLAVLPSYPLHDIERATHSDPTEDLTNTAMSVSLSK